MDRIFVKIFRSPRWCLEGDVTELLGWYQIVMWWHLFDYGSVASLPRKPRPWQSGGLPKSGLLCKRWGGHLLCKRWGGRFYANLGEDTSYANVGVDTFMQTLGWTRLCKLWGGRFYANTGWGGHRKEHRNNALYTLSTPSKAECAKRMNHFSLYDLICYVFPTRFYQGLMGATHTRASRGRHPLSTPS